jgi:hypothetical protein
MNKVWCVLILAVFAVAIGCGAGGGAKGAAEKVLKAVQAGDSDTIMDHIDLKGIYEMQKKQMEAFGQEVPEYDEWEKSFREDGKKDAKPNKEFKYEIIDVKEEGDTATIKVKTKENKDAEWEEDTVTMKKIDGKWKLTMESMAALGD